MPKPAPSSPNLVPFGKYLLDEEIARGGMARVYRARLRGVGGFEKTLVVKQVLPELASDPRFLEMFVQEAKTLVAMSHPNIVPVYELGVVDGVYFLAMEYVEGATVAELVAKGRLACSFVAHIGIHVSDALDYAHSRFHLVHRDVTPRNIMVDATGRVHLLDFGISAATEFTGTGEIVGSYGYMSREQALGEVVTPASDLFSLGVVLYEALSGDKAFLRERPEDTRAVLLERESPRLSPSDAPQPIADLVHRALQHDPAQRPNSAAEMAKRLRSWLALRHPEGVASELGDLADRVMRERKTQASSLLNPLPEGRRDPSGFVKSIATSAMLDALLAPSRETGGQDRTVPIVKAAPHSDRFRARHVFALLGAILCIGSVVGVAIRSSSHDEVVERKRVSVPPVRRHPEQPLPRKAESPISPSVATSMEPPAIAAVLKEKKPERVLNGSLIANALPWAQVKVDGKTVGVTPVRKIQVLPGVHVVEFECPPLGRTVRASIRSEPNKTVRILADLNQSPPKIAVK